MWKTGVFGGMETCFGLSAVFSAFLVPVEASRPTAVVFGVIDSVLVLSVYIRDHARGRTAVIAYDTYAHAITYG